MNDLLTLSNVILDSLGDGVYVCDRERRIVYWSKAAERITGWEAAEVIGRRCVDDVLAHVDKDGHRLCGEEHCPLHRSMVTGGSSSVPLIVFARGKDGRRIPMQVAVAPIRDAAGAVVGGVETFRDMTAALVDLERARLIQALSLEHDLPDDPRIRFRTAYTPHDIVGGDYYAVRRLDDDRYGLILADVSGHGIAAALHTMHLDSLWARHRALLADPPAFAAAVNNDLSRVVKDESFATALCGVIDARAGAMRLTSAAGTPVLVFRAAGPVEVLELPGLPFGVLEDATYDETTVPLHPGDRVLFLSDGAFEIHDARGAILGVDGLVRILNEHGYPAAELPIKAVEEALLRYSNAIRLLDDLTFIEARYLGPEPDAAR